MRWGSLLRVATSHAFGMLIPATQHIQPSGSTQKEITLATAFLFAGIILHCTKASATAPHAENSLTPYIISGQLDLPMPKWSATKQPWRAYAETVPAETYLHGLGINWGRMPPNKELDSVANLLRGAGFSRVRYELPWGAVNWDETGLDPRWQAELTTAMAAFRAHSLRPLILLNGHHLRPCPMRSIRTLVLKTEAAAGAKALEVSEDISDLPAWHTEIISLTTSRRAGPLVTATDNSGHLLLSRPLSASMPAGAKITIGILKYLPLYSVGSPQFSETLNGWKRYVALAISVVTKAYGSSDFDVEVWNELTFGSAFLSINNYTAPDIVDKSGKPPLHRGGAAWALAEAAVSTIGRISPRTKVIWGFSNTSFFHTAIKDLPPGISGQSYHPYNSNKRCMPEQAGSSQYNADSFAPKFCSAIPESVFATFQKTESLFRLLNPSVRTQKPPRSLTFAHFISEHGERAADFGLDSSHAQKMKAKFELRAPAFWLNKGISAFYTYQVYDNSDNEFGLLPAHEDQKPVALSALRRMTKRFSGAAQIKTPRQLEFDYASVGASPTAIAGTNGNAALTHQDLVQILPYQIDNHRFVIPMYVMAFNFPEDLAAETYDITIGNINGRTAQVELYDPLLDRAENISIQSRSSNSIKLRLSLTDSVRLLEIAD